MSRPARPDDIGTIRLSAPSGELGVGRGDRRLGEMTVGDQREVLREAWRAVVPKKLVGALDG